MNHDVTVSEHGADSRLLFLSCSCGEQLNVKPVGWLKAQRLTALHAEATK